MSSITRHSSPSTYALEKAVRIAARKLGRTASIAEVEQEAIKMLAIDGFAQNPEPSSVHPFEHPSGAAGAILASSSDAASLHLSVSAASCASRRLNTQRARLYDLLRKELLNVPDVLRPSVHLHVRDTSSLFVGHSPDVVLVIGETLAAIAEDIPIAGISGPFIDVALTENLPLIEYLPDLVGLATKICPTVQIGTQENGHSEAALSAVSFALAVASSARSGNYPVIVSVNDCDRRAFGHRVHPTVVVAHLRPSSIQSRASVTSQSLNDEWHTVSAADLPLLPGTTPVRTTDLIHPLQEASPVGIHSLLEEGLLAGTSNGARRQLLLLC